MFGKTLLRQALGRPGATPAIDILCRPPRTHPSAALGDFGQNSAEPDNPAGRCATPLGVLWDRPRSPTLRRGHAQAQRSLPGKDYTVPGSLAQAALCPLSFFARRCVESLDS